MTDTENNNAAPPQSAPASGDETIETLPPEAGSQGPETDWKALASDQEQTIEDLREQIATQENEIAALKAAAEKAGKAPRVARAERTEGKARKFDVAKEKPQNDDGDTRPNGALRDRIAAADRVEIVICKDGREITALPPITVAGDAWKDNFLGLMLAEKLTLNALNNVPVAFNGYALLIDGKQAAYGARPDTFHLPGGTTGELVDDIIF